MSTAASIPDSDLLADQLLDQFAALPPELRAAVIDRMAATLAARALGVAATPAVTTAAPERAQSANADYRAPRYATTPQLCRELGIRRTWVYEHRAQLGALALPGPERPGAGRRRPRLRYDMDIARAFWASCSLAQPAEPAKAPRSRQTAAKRPAASAPTPRRAVPAYKFA